MMSVGELHQLVLDAQEERVKIFEVHHERKVKVDMLNAKSGVRYREGSDYNAIDRDVIVQRLKDKGFKVTLNQQNPKEMIVSWTIN